MRIRRRVAAMCHPADLKRLLDFVLDRDPAGPRLKRTPPRGKEDVIVQLTWLGVIS